jgi:hypothetical protein
MQGTCQQPSDMLEHKPLRRHDMVCVISTNGDNFVFADASQRTHREHPDTQNVV